MTRKMLDINSDLDRRYQKLFPGMSRTYVFNELLRTFLDSYEERLPDYHESLKESGRRTVDIFIDEPEED